MAALRGRFGAQPAVAWVLGGSLLIAAVLVALAERPPAIPPLHAEGIATGEMGGVVAVPPRTVARYVVGTSLLEPAILVPGAAIPTVYRIQAARLWLLSGRVPPKGSRYAEMYERALLDLRSLTLENGAFLAGMGTRFRYVWPRDASFAAAAFSVTGHHDDAERILRFLALVRGSDGRWQARYLPDGSGRAPDDRGVQLDGAGWIAWATWLWYTTSPDRSAARATLDELWPMIESSADQVASSLDRSGLPPASPDYRERAERSLTLGTAAPLLAGLRASVDLARQSGRPAEASRWEAAARRLDQGIRRSFGAQGYPRTALGRRVDAAVTFLAPPFAGTDPAVTAATVRSADRLRVRSGGLRPGEGWHRDGVAWTPATAMFALAFAASGERGRAQHWLNWLAGHRTSLGALPERVDARGRPVSVAPLGWTAALVVLAIRTLDEEIPVPPAP